MSTLWTPGGERPVGRPAEAPAPAPPPGEPSEEELEARVGELREQLARTPAEVVVANHAYSLFELAALHLSLQPPQLDQARTAIDALAALVEGMAGRLGEAEAPLVDGLSQLRMAYVQVRSAAGSAGGEQPPSAD